MSFWNSLYEASGLATIYDMFHSDKKEETEQENTVNEEGKKIYVPEQVTPIKYNFRPSTFEEYIGQSNAKERAELTIQKIISGKMSHILISGTKGCFVAGTKIHMADYTCKNIEDIKEGDIILGFDETGFRSVQPSTVLKVYKRNTEELVYIKSDKNEVWTTSEHPFLTSHRNINSLQMQENYHWTPANEVNATHTLNYFPINERNLEWKRGWMLGLLLADGSYIGKSQKYNEELSKKQMFTFYNNNKILVDNYIQLLLDLYQIKPTVLKNGKKYQITSNSKIICRLLNYQYNKIKDNIDNFHVDFLKGFVGGFYDGDGSIYKRTCPSIYNTNLDYINIIERICLKLEFITNLQNKGHTDNIIFKKYKAKKDIYKLSINNKISFFSTFLPFTKIKYGYLRYSDKQKIWFKRVINAKTNNGNKFVLHRIKREVYNLTTSTNTYIANGFPVHNCGKTSLANIIAKELNANMSYYIGGSFTKEKNLKEFLIKNEEDRERLNILFIDEIHNIPKETGEYLYPVLEDFKLPEGEEIKLKPFCFVGCTTEMETLMGKLSPLVDRCGGEPINLEPYTYDDIKQIMKQYNNQVYKQIISDEVFDILSRNARYTPRIALAIIDDYIICNNVEKVLRIRRIIRDSLTDVDLRILRHLNEIQKPVGEQVLAVISNVSTSYYRQLIEPFLLMEGLISRTSRGRVITEKSKHIILELK